MEVDERCRSAMTQLEKRAPPHTIFVANSESLKRYQQNLSGFHEEEVARVFYQKV
jgi:hypothetical protein